MVEIPINVVITPANVRKTKREVLKAFDAIEEEAKRTGRGVEKYFNRGFRGMLEGIKKVKAQWVALAGVITGGIAGGLSSLTRQTLEYADAITKVADKVGVTTTELQQFRLMGQLTGVDVRTMDMALQRFGRRTGEVDRNMGELLKTAQHYGAEVRDNQGQVKQSIDLLKEWADTVQNASSRQEQLAITFKLVDSEGAKLVNLLSLGSEGIDELTKQIDDLNVIIREDTLRDAARAIDSITKLEAVMKAAFTRAVVENAERIAMAIESLINWLVKLLPKTGNIESLKNRLDEINKEIEEQNKKLNDNIKNWKELSSYGVRSAGGFGTGPMTELARLQAERVKVMEEIKKIEEFRKRYGGITGEDGADTTRLQTFGAPGEMFAVFEQGMARAEEQAKEMIALSEQTAIQEAEKVQDVWIGHYAKLEQLRDQQRQREVQEQAKAYERIGSLVKGALSSWQTGFNRFIDTGKLNFSSLVDSMIKDLAKLGMNKIFQMIIGQAPGAGTTGSGLIGLIGGLFRNEKGNVVNRYAKGGIIDRPTIFPARQGMALAGEKNAEAIMPLQRDRRGNLGVSSQGGQVVNIYNIQAVDAKSFAEAARRSGAIPLLAAEGIQNNTILRDAVLNAK